MGKPTRSKTNEVEASASNVDSLNEDRRIAQLESKIDKLVDVLHGFNDRLKKQEEKAEVHELSILPSAQSSPKASGPAGEKSMQVSREAPATIPSFEILKDDDKIQKAIQQRLQHYHNMSRDNLKGNNKATTELKSGRFRSGVQKVQIAVNWPQDFCSVSAGAKQPNYEDLSTLQWVQGYVGCVLDEKDETARQNMLWHLMQLMEDSIELSFHTAKHAQAVVLQEIERCRCDSKNPDLVEKIRCRNTQCPLNVSEPTRKNNKTFLCRHYNEGTCKYDSEQSEGDKVFEHYCVYYFKVVSKKYRFKSIGKPRPKKVTRHLNSIGGPKVILASSFELKISNHHINDKVNVGYSTMTLNISDSQLCYSGQDICPKVPITRKDRSQFNKNRVMNSKLNPNAMIFIVGKQWLSSNMLLHRNKVGEMVNRDGKDDINNAWVKNVY